MALGLFSISFNLTLFLELLLIIHALAASEVPNFPFMKEATTAKKVSRYDYIIIGGGTAACPMAATLSKKYKVLVLERGGSPYNDPNITELAAFGTSLADLSPSSPSQQFISEDGVINARARVLGGGTSINSGIYSRAEPEFVRRVKWDPKLVNESYAWIEDKIIFEQVLVPGGWQEAFRDGLLEAGVRPHNGFTNDHLVGTKTSGSIFDRNGKRHSAADLLHYGDSSNLDVLLHATVSKILFKKHGKSKKATSVIFRDALGITRKAKLKKGSNNEIILSAGAIGSPQLLMLSGIGPAQHLKAHKISVVLDSPMVGQGMADNPRNGIIILSPSPVEISLVQAVGITPVGSFVESGSGQNFTGLMFNTGNGTQPRNRTCQGGIIVEKITGPISTGNLSLRTLNPDDNPSVIFNYFKHPKDLERCVYGVNVIRSVVESKSFARFRYPRISWQAFLRMSIATPTNIVPKPRMARNATMSTEQFCKETVTTMWHYHGGCLVGKVVDQDYKVIGVDNLRVVDSSTFYSSPGTNPMATVLMFGRYMGVKIMRERLASES